MENIRELVFEGWTTKATSKEKGKGPGKGKGRWSSKEDVPSEDGSWGSEAERLRQRILETVGTASSDVEAVGSGQQEGDMEADDAVKGDEIKMEVVREEVEVDEGETEFAAGKETEEEVEEVRKAKRVAEVIGAFIQYSRGLRM